MEAFLEAEVRARYIKLQRNVVAFTERDNSSCSLYFHPTTRSTKFRNVASSNPLIGYDN